MEWGKHEDMLEKRRESGQPAPALDRKPTLYPDVSLVWEMFMMLSADRPIGMSSAGPIPVLNILAFMGKFGPHGVEDCEDYLYLLRAIDAEWLSVSNARSSQAAKGSKGK